MFIKLLKTIVSLILVLSVIGSIGFFIIYPHYTDFKIHAEEYNPERVSHNTMLQLLTTISPPNQAGIITDITTETSLEYISPEEMIRLKNEGIVQFNLEAQNTTLTIDSANIAGNIVDGETAVEMDRGFWHFPLSSQPGKRGNTVIIAHRFLNLPPRTDTFFSLDTVKVGDKIIIEQDEGTYNYTIIQTKIVEKTDRSVLANTTDHRISLITCTPLWTSDQRLVIIGKLDKIYGNI